MRSAVGAAWPFAFLALFLLEVLPLVECVVFLAVELPLECAVVAPEELVFFGCAVLLCPARLCATAAGTVHVPAVSAARISPRRLLLHNLCIGWVCARLLALCRNHAG